MSLGKIVRKKATRGSPGRNDARPSTLEGRKEHVLLFAAKFPTEGQTRLEKTPLPDSRPTERRVRGDSAAGELGFGASPKHSNATFNFTNLNKSRGLDGVASVCKGKKSGARARGRHLWSVVVYDGLFFLANRNLFAPQPSGTSLCF